MSLKAHVSGCHTKKVSKTKQERFFQCGHCDKKYAAPKGLKNHMIIEHEGGPQFGCTICSRKMPCQATLNYHVKQVHTKVTCEICNEVEWVVKSQPSFSKFLHNIPHVRLKPNISAYPNPSMMVFK